MFITCIRLYLSFMRRERKTFDWCARVFYLFIFRFSRIAQESLGSFFFFNSDLIATPTLSIGHLHVSLSVFRDGDGLYAFIFWIIIHVLWFQRNLINNNNVGWFDVSNKWNWSSALNSLSSSKRHYCFPLLANWLLINY